MLHTCARSWLWEGSGGEGVQPREEGVHSTERLMFDYSAACVSVCVRLLRAPGHFLCNFFFSFFLEFFLSWFVVVASIRPKPALYKKGGSLFRVLRLLCAAALSHLARAAATLACTRVCGLQF